MPLDNLTADALNSLEPQRQNNGLLRIVGVASMPDSIMDLAIQSFPLPKHGVGTIEVPHLNEKRKYAGNPTYEDVTVVFTDFVENDIAKAVDDWMRTVHNPTNGRTGFARSYKKNGLFITFGPNGQWERTWNIIGIWPSNYDPGDIDQSGEDYVRISLTLVVDKVTLGSRQAGGDVTSGSGGTVAAKPAA